MNSTRNRFEEEWQRTGRWFSVWFVFCAVAALAVLCGLGWLLFAVVDWLGRH